MKNDVIDIKAGNRLLALFLDGIEEDYAGSKIGTKIWYFPNYPGGTYHLYYDSSWSDLMPVIMKMNRMQSSARPFVFGNPEYVRLKLSKDALYIRAMMYSSKNVSSGKWELFTKRVRFSKYSEIMAYWIIAVEFVKWYNSIIEGAK